MSPYIHVDQQLLLVECLLANKLCHHSNRNNLERMSNYDASRMQNQVLFKASLETLETAISILISQR